MTEHKVDKNRQVGNSLAGHALLLIMKKIGTASSRDDARQALSLIRKTADLPPDTPSIPQIVFPDEPMPQEDTVENMPDHLSILIVLAFRPDPRLPLTETIAFYQKRPDRWCQDIVTPYLDWLREPGPENVK